MFYQESEKLAHRTKISTTTAAVETAVERKKSIKIVELMLPLMFCDDNNGRMLHEKLFKDYVYVFLCSFKLFAVVNIKLSNIKSIS